MLQFSAVSKRYASGLLAIDGIELSVARGEFVGIVGESGCGKSTLLRIASGLEGLTGGGVLLNGKRITAPHPEIGMVFQEPRLMPWLTIRENVAFGIRALPASERQSRVDRALERVGLTSFAAAWPLELSGGMAQRASLARALVEQPSVLLLDEPFSALDALTRADLQDHLADLWSEDRPTVVLVTHDIEEALFLSDRVLVMRGRPGQIRAEVRCDLPRPRDRAGATFQALKRQILAELQHSVGSRSTVGATATPAGIIPFATARAG